MGLPSLASSLSQQPKVINKQRPIHGLILSGKMDMGVNMTMDMNMTAVTLTSND